MITQRELLSAFVLVLFRRKWLILTTFLVVVLGVALYTYLGYPLYKATVTILVHENPRQQLILFHDMATPAEPNIKINPSKNLTEMSRSPGLARQIVAQYSLDERARRRHEDPGTFREWCWYLLEAVINSPFKLGEAVGLLDPSVPNYPGEAIEQFLEDRQDVSYIQDTELVKLAVWEESPALAAGMANTLAQLLVDKALAMARSKASVAFEFTERQVALAEEELARIEDALARFRRDAQLIEVSQQKSMKLKRLDELQTKYFDDLDDQARLEARAEELRRKLEKEAPEILSATVVTPNPLAIDLQSSLFSTQAELSSREPELQPANPEMASLQARADNLAGTLSGMDETIVQSRTTAVNPQYQDLRAELTRIEAELRGVEENRVLSAEMEALQKEMKDLPALELELQRLERAKAAQEDLYTNLKKKLAELEVQRVNRMSEIDIGIIDQAFVAPVADPDEPEWDIMMAIALASGLVLALSLAFLWDYCDESYGDSRALERDLDLPSLGSVPYFREPKR